MQHGRHEHKPTVALPQVQDGKAQDIEFQQLLVEQMVAAQRVMEASYAMKDLLVTHQVNVLLPEVPALSKEVDNEDHEAEEQAEGSDPEIGAKSPLLSEDGNGAAKLFLEGRPHHERLYLSSKRRRAKPYRYRVEDLYEKVGCWQAIAKAKSFHVFMFAAISLNVLWVGISIDYNQADMLADAPWWIQVGENVFCIIFSVEIIVRFMAFKKKCDACTDEWFVFDFFLAALMVWATWLEGPVVRFLKNHVKDGNSSSAVLRVFRLSRFARSVRVGRVSRFLREVPELAILSRALVCALRSVGATMLLLIVTIYVFAVLFTQLLSGVAEFDGEFDTVPLSMHRLLVQGVFPDQAELVDAMFRRGFVEYCVLLIFLLVTALTMANMLVGVICDLIGKMSTERREEMAKDAMERSIRRSIFHMDRDSNRKISRTEFRELLFNTEAAKVLVSEGVDLISLSNHEDVIFEEESKELTAREFMDVVMAFKGSDSPMKHQLELKQYMKEKMDELGSSNSLGRGRALRSRSPARARPRATSTDSQ